MAVQAPMDEFFRSQFEDKLLASMPAHDSDHLTPAARLLAKRREGLEVETALRSQKEEFESKMEELEVQRRQLEQKEYELRVRLMEQQKHFKDIEVKCNRAMKKAQQEQMLTAEQIVEDKQLRQESAGLAQYRDKQLQKLQKLQHCAMYMDRSVEAAEEFTEVQEVMNRYHTLSATRKDLLEHDQTNQDDIERHRACLAKFKEERNNEMLACNNEIAHLQAEKEEAKSITVKWEGEWAHIQNTAAEKTLTIGQIRMATRNLFLLVNKYVKADHSESEEDTTSMLDRIEVFIRDLSDITQEIAKQPGSSSSLSLTPAMARYQVALVQ